MGTQIDCTFFLSNTHILHFAILDNLTTVLVISKGQTLTNLLRLYFNVVDMRI